ncbi:MAG: AraC family transcriptional regulator [Candidatus Marinimicrobia bacterium]|nr:AraC family transcriptional regulator [Candidatus Neomarinimicrobiota bacterium]
MHNSDQRAPPYINCFAVPISVKEARTCPMHSHACTEIIGYQKCRGHLRQADGCWPYHDGDVGVYQPGVDHADECEQGGVQFCVGVNGGRARALRPGAFRADRPTLHLLNLIQTELIRHDAGRAERLNLLSGLLVLELQRVQTTAAQTAASEPYHVAALRQILDTRFDEPLSISEIARDLRIHPDYLGRIFARATGEPPVRYLIRKRLEAACELLRLNQSPIAEVARLVGIENPYYFSRLFRQRYGLTPSAYRARHAGGKPEIE